MSSSGGGVLGGELNTISTNNNNNNNNEKTKSTNTNISEETTTTLTATPESSSPNDHQNQSSSENSSSTGGDFMSDWKSFAAKATSSFNEASQSISETLRESGVNDVVASTTTNVKFYANSAYDMSANAASNAAEFTTNAAKDTMSALQSLDRERIAWSMAFTFVSGLSLTLAFTVGIATIALFPAKFALCFSLFSVSNICAVGALRGANEQIKHMLDPERLYVSCGFVGTILFTLWAALIKHSYFLTVMASIAQALALLYYQLSFFPMGAEGFRVVCKVAYATVVKPTFLLALRFVGMVLPTGGSVGHARRRSASLLPT
jgi:hypothetical protein